jgi:hypothetical protein
LTGRSSERAMHLPFRRNHPKPEPLWRRLDRAAGEINPFLLIFAVGLVFLYLTCVVGLLLKLPLNRVDNYTAVVPAATQLPKLTEPSSGF